MALDEDEILKLYKDISFPASFRGLKTFQAVLKSDKGIEISEQKLRRILQKEPIYLIHQLKPFKIKRRSTITHNYGELTQADIAFMFSDSDNNKPSYFLLLVDVYSGKVFVEVLPNKESHSVAKALEDIFKRFGAPIYEIQTDKGSEFKGRACSDLFKRLKVLHRTKRGLNKASFAEAAIFRVKRKLYMYLRANLSKNWKSSIQSVVDGLNNIPQKRLGFLTPNSITNVESSAFVDKELKAHNLPVPKDATYQEQRKNQQNYEKLAAKNENLIKEGDYVYLKLNEDIFGKSFDIQVFTYLTKFTILKWNLFRMSSDSQYLKETFSNE